MKKSDPCFSSRLRTLRGNLSQKEMAEKLGIPQQTYCGWELGNRQPKLDKLAEIASQFAVSVDWLLGFEGTGPSSVSLTVANGSAAASGNAAATVSSPLTSNEMRLMETIATLSRTIERQESLIAHLLGANQANPQPANSAALSAPSGGNPAHRGNSPSHKKFKIDDLPKGWKPDNW